MDIVRVFRVVVYTGPRDWVEKTIAQSIQGVREVGPGKRIEAATIGLYPEIVNKPFEKEQGNKPTLAEWIDNEFNRFSTDSSLQAGYNLALSELKKFLEL